MNNKNQQNASAGSKLMVKKPIEIKTFLDEYVIGQDDAKKVLAFHNMVSPPLVPEKKDSPKRAIVMILFTLSAMLIAIVSAVYIEQYRDKLKSQLQ